MVFDELLDAFYDDADHPLETINALGYHKLSGYNRQDQITWSEDEDGNPTDNTYDPVVDLLTQTQAPDPDGAGSLGRPTTKYRYDELKIGDGTNPGLALHGLHASYFPNSGFSGRPTVEQTDSQVDFNWGTSGPAALNYRNDNFSVRWAGILAVSQEGDYNFSATSDGNTTLVVSQTKEIDGSDQQSAVITDTDQHAPATVSSQPVHLKPGVHQLVIEYVEMTGAAGIQLRYSCSTCSPQLSDQVIPNSVMQPVWGNQTSAIDPSGRVLFRHYPEPAKSLADYTQQKLGDGTPLITSYAYDEYGRPLQKIMPKGNVGRTIDSQGNLQGSADERYATDWIYYGAAETASAPTACGGGTPLNQSQLLKSSTPYGISSTTNFYDSAGRVMAVTTGKGTTCNTYSAEGNLMTSKAPGESQPITYTYDPGGNLRSSANTSSTVATDYDEAGRIEKSVDSFGAEAVFAYDNEGDLLTRTAATGPLSSYPNYVTAFAYDDARQITSITDPAGRQYHVFYCKCGRVKAIQYPNGTFSWVDSNSVGWTTGVFNHHGSLSAPLPSSVPTDTQGSPIVDYTYAYYIDGKQSQEVRTGGGLSSETTSYSYDELGRLSQATLPDGTNRTYSYDLDSNRAAVRENGTTVATYTYDSAVSPGVDELTSVTAGGTTTAYAYDSDGETVSRGGQSIRWDGRGRHVGGTFGAATLDYTFDAAGFRRQRSSGASTRQYRLGGMFETDGSGTITLTSVDSPAGDLAHYAGPPTTSSAVTYEYFNGHGDLGGEADQLGSRTAAYTYDPFGSPRSGGVPSDAAVERWVGRANKKFDTTSLLIEMGVRPYDIAVGRFLSRDPAEGGSLNAYDYAGQDPVNDFDLDGNMPTNYVCRSDPTHSWGNGKTRFCLQSNIPAPAKFDPTKSYASVPKNLERFVGWSVDLGRFKKLWNRAAYDHDVCYGSQIYVREACDQQFLLEMYYYCQGVSDTGFCEWMARQWYRAIRSYGGGHYDPRTSGDQP